MRILLFLILIIFLIFNPTTAIASTESDKAKLSLYILQAESLDNNHELTKIQYAIANIESSFGTNLVGDDHKSYGPFQMKIPTAKMIAKKYDIPAPASDWEMKNKLLNDFSYAVLLNRLYTKELITKYHGNIRLAMLAYNQGEPTIDYKIKKKHYINPKYYNKFIYYYNITKVPAPIRRYKYPKSTLSTYYPPNGISPVRML